jgi:hypothetical protein
MKNVTDKMVQEFGQAMRLLPAILEYDIGLPYEDSGGVFIDIKIRLEFPEGIVRKKHGITLACYDLDDLSEYGIDYSTSDADVGAITPENIMISLYFDLGLSDIEDEHLQ